MDTNIIICGKSEEVLKTFPDKSVKIAVTSPPYNGGGKNLGGQPNSTVGQQFYDEYTDNLSDEDYFTLVDSVLEQSLRVADYVFYNIQFLTNTKAPTIRLINKYQDRLKDVFIWKKQAVAQIGSSKENGRFATGFEFVWCFGADGKRTFNNVNFPDNGYLENIQTWYKSEHFNEHHATFPMELPTFFIKNFTKEGDVILDPFNGTGTTCVAAHRLNRKYIGVDISKNYCNLATQRIEREKEIQRGQFF